jgi:hypothetical protein
MSDKTAKALETFFRPAKNKNGKILYVPKETDNFLVWNYPDDYNFFEENKDFQEQILWDMSEGLTLTGACKKLKIPISLVLLYAEKCPEFEKALQVASRFRAETYHDKFANIAEEVTEGTAKSAKVKADILRHLMALGNRDKFGEQKKISKETSTTVTFVVDTGIRREIPVTGEIVQGEIADGRGEQGVDNEDLDGVSAEAPATPDPCEAEKV